MRSPVSLAALTAILVLGSCSAAVPVGPVAELAGPWEFYPETFLDPQGRVPAAPMTLTVPAQLMPSAWGTYRMVVPLDPHWRGRDLWLEVPDAHTALRAYADGVLVGTMGDPGASPAAARPQNRQLFAALPPARPFLILVIHASNHENVRGGLVTPPRIWTHQSFLASRSFDGMFTWFLIGAFLFLAAYHGVLTWVDRRMTLSLRFSVLMVFVVLRLLLVPEFLYSWFDAFGVLIRIEYLSFYAIVPVCLAYFRGLYPEELPRPLVAAVAAAALACSAVTLVSPLLVTSSVLLPAYRFLTLAMVAVVAVSLVRALVHHREDSGLVTAAGLVLLVCTVVEVLFYSRWISSMLLTRVGLLVFVFSQSLLMARRHSRLVRRLETLNQGLELEVSDRTRHLNEALVRLEEVSQSDPLTGLRNRRYFQSALVPRLESLRSGFSAPGEFREKRGQFHGPTRYAFLLLDIDHFKAVNDQYGHPAGDAVLRRFAQILTSAVRQDDVVVRWGGEEFLVVLADADRTGAWHVAEKLRLQVALAEFSLGEGQALTLRKTASIGLAAFPFDGLRPGAAGWPAVLDWADAGLYEAKKTGRNRVVAVVPGPGYPSWDGSAAAASGLLAQGVLALELRPGS